MVKERRAAEPAALLAENYTVSRSGAGSINLHICPVTNVIPPRGKGRIGPHSSIDGSGISQISAKQQQAASVIERRFGKGADCEEDLVNTVLSE